MIADIIAQDARGRDVLVVLVKGRSLDPDTVDAFFETAELECPSVPFSMIVSIESIFVRKQGCERRPGTFVMLDTDEVFRHYDREFGSMRVFQDTLIGLTDLWLLELSLPRASQIPPGIEELRSLGLLDMLKGGVTKREVPLGADSLR